MGHTSNLTRSPIQHLGGMGWHDSAPQRAAPRTGHVLSRAETSPPYLDWHSIHGAPGSCVVSSSKPGCDHFAKHSSSAGFGGRYLGNYFSSGVRTGTASK